MNIKISRFIYVITLYFVVFNLWSQSNILITKDNYQEEITKRFYEHTRTDDDSLLEDIFTFSKLHENLIKNDTIVSKLLYFKGVKEIVLENFFRAEEYFLETEKFAKKYNDTFLLATSLSYRAIALSRRNEYLKAEKLYLQAITEYEKLSDKFWQIDAYYNLSSNARRRSDWKLSLKYAKAAIKLIEELQQKKQRLKYLNYFVGNSYLELKEHELAHEYLTKAEKLLIPEHNYARSLIDKSLAKNYEAKGELLKAIEKYESVNASLHKTNDIKQNRIKNMFAQELALESSLKQDKDLIIANQKNLLALSVVAILLFIVLTGLLIFFSKKTGIKQKR